MHKEQLSQELLDRITTKAESTIREVISAALTEEINRALTMALTEGEFYRSISTDLQEGLKSIYLEINSAATGTAELPMAAQAAASPVADEMFSEASTQLGAILQTTEKATDSIMELVEKHLDMNDRAMQLLASLENGTARPEIAELRAGNEALGADLMEIMTTLSFQDLTGQRIKRIVAALQQIEKVVFELYMATGLSMKAMEQNPEQSVEEIRQMSKARATELKGPQDASTQTDVDDLLSQLGL
ncbi:chemotaxis protein CheZ [Desulfomicrobium norvegicum]|uniref:Chemotaxis protein CheZ n=1 Tax=Desulfomicrobium norvegicum (strain DSM 1741 / NCIMB 8310) TaxID=52561 RepID=A0A8G2C346_DESNO|nr:protein phosphatase CheZ [Desulfomicrobium norvegicum]SFL76919.1 chemotaxis protein CheZ [Desulfomicrobium norvegicum]